VEKAMLKPTEICDETISMGFRKSELTSLQMAVLGTLAGFYISFGCFASTAASYSIKNPGASKFVGAAVFPVGLILVIICGAELFTGNSLMFLTLLQKKIKWQKLLKNWAVVYFSNLLGALLISLLIYGSGLLSDSSGRLGGFIIKTALDKCSLSFINCFASGILCNILVCIAVWGASASRDVTGKVFALWFPVMTLVVSGFEHSIANMYFLSIGLLAKSNAIYAQASGLAPQKLDLVNISNILGNLIPVTLGNILGGMLIAATYWTVYKYIPLIKAARNTALNR
jgi:formate transporter